VGPRLSPFLLLGHDVSLTTAKFSVECVEFADARFMEALNHSLAPNASSQPYLVSDSLFIKLQGTPSIIAEASKAAREILSKHGCNRVRFARDDEESREIWGHRRGALLAILSYIEGSKVWTTDVW
jgi:D-lactate dehydrogenase (cytochrome)